jgi:beta-glucanase (GH16 family)
MLKVEYLLLMLVMFGSLTAKAEEWQLNFFDDFDTFNPENWQDQLLWVNNEDQCYVRDGKFGTREVSNGTLKLRVVDIGEARECDNMSKFGQQHPPTRYIAGRLASKNLQEFVKGKWTARLRLSESGLPGMFPAWWILGARNNEPPVQEDDENICWPLPGSGEIDIWEHYGSGGADHFAVRAIAQIGGCEDGGDWETHQVVVDATLTDFHEYSVEWAGNDLIYRVDGQEVARNDGVANDYAEPFFAILNYAKMPGSTMEQSWTMEVDWVKHESLKD